MQHNNTDEVRRIHNFRSRNVSDQGVRIEGGETLVLIFDATYHSDSSLPIGLLSYQL